MTTRPNEIHILQQPYAAWLTELRSLFPVANEYDLAAEIYSFHAAFEDGFSPQKAYDDFDQWVSA